MYKHPPLSLLFLCSTHIKVGCWVHDALLFSHSSPSRGSRWREMAVNGVMIGKMIGEIEISILWTMPTLLLKRHWLLMELDRTHESPRPECCREAVDTPITDGGGGGESQHFEVVPQGFCHKVKEAPRKQSELDCTRNHRWIQTTAQLLSLWWRVEANGASEWDKIKRCEQRVEPEQAEGTLGTPWWCCQRLM